MVGANDDLVEPTRRFLDGFKIIALDDEIARRAVQLRRAHRIKLPDAVIWATAQTTARLLVTRNTKDFSPDDPGVRKLTPCRKHARLEEKPREPLIKNPQSRGTASKPRFALDRVKRREDRR